jgi:catechol 2,3-dioxygenase-like lactoylglutathione lyase family enzyme
MTEPLEPPACRILGLHHFAWRCRDAEETRHFYEDLLGLPLHHMIQSDHVPSTGEHCPYTHIFFRMADGSFLAFFDLGDDTASAASPNTPAWVNHIALRVGSIDALLALKTRLEQAGVEVLGVIDHRIFRSIYFLDPNGVRVELAAQLASPAQMDAEAANVHARLRDWDASKRARRLARDQPPRDVPLEVGAGI